MEEASYCFGPFRFDASRADLTRDGVSVPVGARALELLEFLLEREGALATKDELNKTLWPSVVVEESNLSTQVWSLRKALADTTRPHRWIITVPGRGYRFAGPVTRAAKVSAPDHREATAVSLAAPADVHELHNLPRQMTTLLGRDADLATVTQMLANHRLVTLVGAGGLGKTQLALQIATRAKGRLADGVWFVALERVERAEQIGETVAGALGLALQGAGSATAEVAGYLKRKALLLVLDNCEHLVLAVAALTEAVLDAAPAVQILATSREPLGLPDERMHRLGPLAFPAGTQHLSAAEAGTYPAVQLFVERASAALGAFTLTDASAPLVGEICRRLDGIALAIELASARLKILPLADLLAGLQERFRILTGGSRTAMPRQRTLEATIGWSYELLSEEERALLRRLAVFGGSFTLADARHVAADPAADMDVLELVASFVDKSLVVGSMNEAGRFRLFESTRAFCLGKLQRAEADECNRRLALEMVARYRAAERERDALTTDAWLARYLPDVDNLRAGLTWGFGPGGDPSVGVSLVSYTSEIWWDLSLEGERRHWLDLAGSHIGEATPPGEKARILLMPLPAAFGKRENLGPALQAAALFRQTGETVLLAQSLRAAAMAVAGPGSVLEAEPPLDEAEAMLRRLGRSRALLSLLETKATIRKFAGDFAGARRVHEECLSLARSYGAHRSMLLTQLNLAEIEFAEGRVDAAIALAREARATARRKGFQRYLAAASQNLAGYLLSVGEIAEARGAAREALEIKRALETSARLAPCVEHLGLVAAMEGDIDRAARMAGYGAACYRREGMEREPTEQATWTGLGQVLASRLSPAERDRLMAEGATWSDDEAVAVALDDRPSSL